MLKPGDVVPYLDVCRQEGLSLQKGMNYRLRGGHSVILMSVRKGAPYADRVEDDGQTLIYEGHDIPRRRGGPAPKTVDQPRNTGSGRFTENGLFFEAAMKYKKTAAEAELVRVYEKIRPGIWAYNGVFRLVDAWTEDSNGRLVFKFRLELTEECDSTGPRTQEIERNRLIPTSVKIAVWKRDAGKCVICDSKENLHFDHVIPYSTGGSSLVPENIQLLCARHNLEKRDRLL